jgi:hypothetical protein
VKAVLPTGSATEPRPHGDLGSGEVGKSGETPYRDRGLVRIAEGRRRAGRSSGVRRGADSNNLVLTAKHALQSI